MSCPYRLTKGKRMGVFLVDIDGTVAKRNTDDPNVRSPFDWSRVDEDLPNQPVIDVVWALADSGHKIIYVSGRSDACRKETGWWLDDHVGEEIGDLLLMREDGDHRSDAIVKRELYEKYVEPVYGKPTAVLDDRNKVVKMWREELGLTVLQVAEGDF